MTDPRKLLFSFTGTVDELRDTNLVIEAETQAYILACNKHSDIEKLLSKEECEIMCHENLNWWQDDEMDRRRIEVDKNTAENDLQLAKAKKLWEKTLH